MPACPDESQQSALWVETPLIRLLGAHKYKPLILYILCNSKESNRIKHVACYSLQ